MDRAFATSEDPACIIFGPFEVHASAGKLYRGGVRVRLSGQPFQILLLLLRHPGEVVTREHLRKEIWGEGTFVDFEHSLNAAVNKLRRTLGDSADHPTYIETLTGCGYRFIGSTQQPCSPVSVAAAEPVANPTAIGNGSPVEKMPQPRQRAFAWQAVLLSTMLVVLAAVVVSYLYSHRRPKLTNTDTIVLADLMNATGDPVFDGTIKQGLAIQLAQSPFLSLVSEERIRQTLRLMGRSPDAPLNPQIAHEVCERTGGTTVLEGSLAKLGTRYVLGLIAKNCSSGEIVDREQVQAARKEDVLDALTRIASTFRRHAGESLATIQQHNVPLADASTPSLEALKAYSNGWKVLSSTGHFAALPLFQRALEIDPKFAMAHASLARLYSISEDPSLAAESAGKAYELRDRATDRERFFISASYEIDMTGNLQKARQTCEAWSQAYPRDAQVHGFLAGMIYPTFANYENAVNEARKAIEIDPDLAIAYEILAYNYQYLGRLDDAQDALRRASERKLELPEYIVRQHDIAFLRADEAGMERAAALAKGNLAAEEWMADHEAFVLAYSGRLREAKTMLRRAVELGLRASGRERAALYTVPAALWDALFGNAPGATQTAMEAANTSRERYVEYGAAFALALAGDSTRSEALSKDLEERFGEDTAVRVSYIPAIRAQLAVDRGEPAEAVNLLQTATPYELGAPRVSVHGNFGALYPIYVRGEAYLALHRGDDAAVEFQKIIDHRGVVAVDPVAALAYLQLGRALVMAGDPLKAKAAYAAFLTLWKKADSDIPVLNLAKMEYAKLQRPGA
jgi:DNA-binding winged helix-turn-helix (wHTH) protein/tetratricopeptide (TPR) repeat protein